jgi:putative oxidoreductase
VACSYHGRFIDERDPWDEGPSNALLDEARHGRPAVIAVPARVRDLYDRASAIRDARVARDLALLAARLGLAWVFNYNGGGKLFGLFGGGGVHQSSRFFSQIAHLHPAVLFTVMAGITEFFGGIAVGLGIFGRIAAVGLTGDMIVAMATVTFGNGISVADCTTAACAPGTHPGGNYQINVALATLALVVAFLGTGRFSLDDVLRRFLARTSAPEPGLVGQARQPDQTDRSATPGLRPPPPTRPSAG